MNRDWMILAAILVGKLALQLLLLNAGFFAVSGDDYLRALIGAEWAQQPFFAPEDFGRASILWLPLPFWTTGIANWIVGDIWLAPIVANLFFGLIGIAVLFFLTKALFGRREAVIAAVLGAVLPWHAWMSLSALADPPYQVAILVAFLGLVRWEQSERVARKWLFTASIALFFGAMCRPEAWLFASAFGAYLGWIFLFEKRLRWTVATAAAIPFLFVLFWLFHNYRLHGNATEFVGEARSSMARESGEGDSILSRIALFPVLLVLISPIVTIVACGSLGLGIIRKKLPKHPVSAYLFISALAFLLLVAGFVAGMGTNTTPQRFVVIFALLLCPIAASVFVRSGGFQQPRKSTRRPRRLEATTTIVLLAITVLWSLAGVFRHPDDFRGEAEAGRLLRELASEGKILTEDNLLAAHGIMPENQFIRIRSQCRDWAVMAMSNQPDRFPIDVRTSCVWQDEVVAEKARKTLESGDVRVILARKPEALDLVPDDFNWIASTGGFGVFVRGGEPLETAAAKPDTPLKTDFGLTGYTLGRGLFPAHIDLTWEFSSIDPPESVQLRFHGPAAAETAHVPFHPAILRSGAKNLTTRLPFPGPREIKPGYYRIELVVGDETADLGEAWLVPMKRDALKAFLSGENRDIGMLIRVLISL